MYKHILIPIDGSAVCDAALPACLKFAQGIGATVTGLHVTPPFHTLTYVPEMLEDTREQYERDSAARAGKLLASLRQAAEVAGVPCATVHAQADHPYEAIIATAAEKGCDLIAMAPHGHRGIKGMLLGSETQKVLTHSALPVLVLR